MSYRGTEKTTTLGSLPPKGGLTTGSGRTNGSGLTNGTGRTNGGGLTNGSGRTNGSSTRSGRTNGGGLTNGSGRTNGSGLTNGSGRTNGNGPEGRVAARLHAVRAGRGRRKVLAAAVIMTIVAAGALTALGFAAASSTPAVDGRFVEWDGAAVAVSAPNALGLTGLGFQPMRQGVEGYLAFAEPVFSTRADVWVFIDEDGNSQTGYWDGSVGADSAVRISGVDGKVLGASQLRFSGSDRFNLNSLAPSGSGRAAMDGARLEFGAPAVPLALSVALALQGSATTTGALMADGTPNTFAPPGSPALSGEVRNGIRIDGSFEDWNTVLAVPDAEDALPARLDLIKAAAIGDDASAQFFLETRGGVLSGTLPIRAEPIGSPAAQPALSQAPPRRVAGTDLFELYLDTDLRAATGVAVDGIGADMLLRVEGVSGVVVLTQLFTFSPSLGWALSGATAEAAAAGAKLEASVAAAGLVGARAKFVLTGFEGLRDINDQPVAVNRQAGAVVSSDFPPLPSTRADPLASPIPEIGDVAAVIAGVLAITLFIGRRRTRPQLGRGPDAER